MCLHDIISFAIKEKAILNLFYSVLYLNANANYLFTMAGINRTILSLTHCDLLLIK